MDTWNDVFTDQKGVRRCRRCQHARPEKKQDIPQDAVSRMLKGIQQSKPQQPQQSGVKNK